MKPPIILIKVIVIFCWLTIMEFNTKPCMAANMTVSTTVQSRPAPNMDIFTPRQWKSIDRTVDRALDWLAKQQSHNGSFPTYETGQPAVTALCVMAFLSRGNLPGEGRYGDTIERATSFVISCQQPDGLIALVAPIMPVDQHNPSHTAMYNNAIAGLMLCEVYGMTKSSKSRKIKEAIENALAWTKKKLPSPKRRRNDQGGWRYAKHRPLPYADSDLSVTSWQLMFLRSCKNAGFDVPSQYIDEALQFVQRCYSPRHRTFVYSVYHEPYVTRGMAGAGVLSLSLGGKHMSDPAQRAGEWILRHPFDRYLQCVGIGDRFFYSAFYCSQAMFQLG
ncbi:MAG: prenyltransferase/squalene oxidase repeat-containing protein, partial [Planctomycetota bacterium]